MDEWLRKIEGSGLPGNFKAWLFQHGLLPRLAWLLMISKARMTSVEGMEERVNKHFRKCLGVPPSFMSVGLYIQSSQLQPWWKSTKYRALMMFCDSGDVKVRGSGVTTRSGRKWAADTSMAKEESVLKLKDIIGHVCLGSQRQHTLPTMWQGRPKAEERADSSRGPTPGEGEAYGKSQLS